jgi:hypothetical protein
MYVLLVHKSTRTCRLESRKSIQNQQESQRTSTVSKHSVFVVPAEAACDGLRMQLGKMTQDERLTR